MNIKDQMDSIYSNFSPEKIPWNIDNPPYILTQLVDTNKIKPCKTIDLGCGAGNYIIYLATKGFDATGIDISESAIKIAKQSALNKGVKCKFLTADILDYDFETDEKFNFAYDWEVLHHIFPEDREKYVCQVSKLLNPRGQYMSVCFSEDTPKFGGKGKYRKTPIDTMLYFSTEDELKALFRTIFEIEELKTVDIEGKFGPNKAIYALLKKNYN